MASLPAGTSTSSSADLIGLALRSKRVEYYLPFMIGVWLDAICLGLLLVAFGAWVSSVRKTDTPLVRYLVLYLMVASFMMSGFMMGQWFLIYVHGECSSINDDSVGASDCLMRRKGDEE